jgi:hypothetical protein
VKWRIVGFEKCKVLTLDNSDCCFTNTSSVTGGNWVIVAAGDVMVVPPHSKEQAAWVASYTWASTCIGASFNYSAPVAVPEQVQALVTWR